MFFNIHGKSSKYLKCEVKTNLVQGFRFYVTFCGDGKRACRFLNNAKIAASVKNRRCDRLSITNHINQV